MYDETDDRQSKCINTCVQVYTAWKGAHIDSNLRGVPTVGPKLSMGCFKIDYLVLQIIILV